MDQEWDEEYLRRHYLEPETEESQFLDYKRAGALENTNKNKTELTKDVSALANAVGGILVYGIAETDAKPSKPVGFDPVDGSKVTKEWLAQVINNISPHVSGLVIHPVKISEPSGYVYVVEVPESITAHQATDGRYYKRLNFESVPLPDHEIRLIMHRGTSPVVEPEFTVERGEPRSGPAKHNTQVLHVKIHNRGPGAVNNFKLSFTFPNLDQMAYRGTSTGVQIENVHREGKKAVTVYGHDFPGLKVRALDEFRLLIEVRSSDMLFPDDTADFNDIGFTFLTSSQILAAIAANFRGDSFGWKLYADNMPPKAGVLQIEELITYGSERLSSNWATRRGLRRS